MLARVVETAQAAGWSARSVGRVAGCLQRMFDGHPGGQPVRLSQVRAAIPARVAARLVRTVLDELGQFVDDTAPAIHAWIDRQCDTLPAGYHADVRAWLLELAEGSDRTRPRSPSTLYVYFGRVRPHLLVWSATREQLRQVTEDDISTVLDSLRGHQRAGTFTALRSLFQFAKRRRLVFADPTRRLHVGSAPQRVLLPMTDTEIEAVKQLVVTPAQRLVVALTAVHAARPAAIRALTLDDIDLPRRGIRLGGHTHRLSEFVRRALVNWLKYRHRAWPHTPNRHVLISMGTAAGTEPVTDYYLTWHLRLHGVQLERIRGDRVLHEALEVGPDPLHLAAAFNLSAQTAIEYAEIAKSLLEQPIEAIPQPDFDAQRGRSSSRDRTSTGPNRTRNSVRG